MNRSDGKMRLISFCKRIPGCPTSQVRFREDTERAEGTDKAFTTEARGSRGIFGSISSLLRGVDGTHLTQDV